jgi:ribosomal protein S18 acetylase RimI-like enzyme
MPPSEAFLRIRPAASDDLEVLWAFLAMAAYEPEVSAAKAVPFVATHLAGWRRDGDFGFIAEHDGIPLGAAWARQYSPDEQPLFYVDSRTPEITIAVKPDARGQGIGGTLIEALFAEARRRGIGLCLNVRHDNPARRLYERAGFRLLPGCGFPNRVGGTSFGMIWPGSGNLSARCQ